MYYTQLFRALLDAMRGRYALNFHPSLLPRHRGVAPLIWAIAEGDAKAGLTVHHIDADVDAGRIVMQRPLPIHRDDTGFSLHMKTAKLVRATDRRASSRLSRVGRRHRTASSRRARRRTTATAIPC